MISASDFKRKAAIYYNTVSASNIDFNERGF